ncbi:histidine phosphatase family protein [Wenxinia saemankumensis]|uniref:Probable phosphoglycerate mutase n=1 Tax=Wenxinia saemankumensis TaxID=1447782 RepID=A0A1M6CLM3_9RHOB|nr:histidine phosphatase family protein [Wenxinia saemankumensis]SHI61890.1 probable phosphoglycerate mutase [Wenxinia saemankumensis]
MTALPEILVLRHGETEWNRAGRWQGPEDSPLTERGIAQGRAMGRLLAELGVGRGSHAFRISPQGRARATMELVLGELGLPRDTAGIDPDLREIGVGAFGGLHRDEIARRLALRPSDSFFEAYRRAPGGEGFAALYDRVGRALDTLRGPTVIVTHGMTSRFLRTRAMGLGLDRIEELPGGQGIVYQILNGVHRGLPAMEGDAI